MEENPYATPESRVENIVFFDDEEELANRGPRLRAFLLNVILIAVALVPMLVALIQIVMLVGVVFSEAHAEDVLHGDVLIMFELTGVALLVLLVINLVLLYRHGQSIGKRVTRVKIVRQDGSRCGLWRILLLRMLVNFLLLMVPFLGNFYPLVDALFIFREDRRCIHDHIADTIVVKA